MKLNNKGFTLIEVLAVVVILSLLLAIMIPSVNTLINKNKEANYEDLKSSIKKAAKMYFSDNRYEIVVDNPQNGCYFDENGNYVLTNVKSIKDISLFDENNDEYIGLPINVLVDAGNLKTTTEGEILDPRNTSKKLKLNESYVVVKYHCDKKDYVYELNELNWSE